MRDVNINRKMFSLILYITLLMIFVEVVEIIASFENRQDRVVVCLFVFCLFGVNRPTREFSIIWKRHHYR